MKRLWIAFALTLGVSFSVLGWIGSRIYQEVPPIPERIVTADGRLLTSGDEIRRGQNVWQSMGGMEVGSVWGHGGYVAPDWTADYLHREATHMLDVYAQAEGATYSSFDPPKQGELRGRLVQDLRTNRFDAGSKTITVSEERAAAFTFNLAHYHEVFVAGNDAYAIPAGTIEDPARLRDLVAFFSWTAWAAVTNRPGLDYSYTSNWPFEPLVDNRPTGDSVVWTGVSIIMLLAGLSAMTWWYAAQRRTEPAPAFPAEDPLRGWKPTPSQRATLKYFVVVAGLFLLQIVMGVVSAHYGVEGNGFYGIPLARWLPYVVSRTWHVQLGLFWIATAWLGAGLFIAPMIGGGDPRGQRFGVNLLFGALVLIVLGSLAGEWASVFHRLSDRGSFFFGHQGYEYVDLGRVWQIGVFAGLVIWMTLVVRATLPALRRSGEHRPLLTVFLLATGAIALFYGAGLTWGQHTHLSIVEYWRWWVVHLWVEGFFEVFATTVIAFFFTKLGLIRPLLAARAALLSATIYLAGGIIGTCHHLYWSGTPTVALAWGSVFSALEVVPLALVAYPAIEDLRLSRATAWMQRYRWPIYFFVAVAFWNMLGAGLFGFMINPPVALYYMQGLNTTPVHGHAALFGVYGMLGIALILVCLRSLLPEAQWNERLLGFSFWSLNLGVFAMCVLSLLPVGLMQTFASVEHGYWYARSTEFMSSPVLQFFRWLRVPGDTLFAAGAVGFVVFVLLAAIRPRAAGRMRELQPAARSI